jgi:hypothetical protein
MTSNAEKQNHLQGLADVSPSQNHEATYETRLLSPAEPPQL